MNVSTRFIRGPSFFAHCLPAASAPPSAFDPLVGRHDAEPPYFIRRLRDVADSAHFAFTRPNTTLTHAPDATRPQSVRPICSQGPPPGAVPALFISTLTSPNAW